jgi:uncharacterized repeat protein (TIGR03803 family)
MRKISGRFGTMMVITASMGMMLAAAVAAPAQESRTLLGFDNANGAPMSSCNSITCSFRTLVDFNGFSGYVPQASLVQGTDGNLYGTTTEGGNGFGTIFKMTPAGTVTTLYSFRTQANCSDGATPYGSLVLGTDENFYGTTAGGGAGHPNPCYFGDGTIFKITPSGTLTTLHVFRATDGSYPHAGLIQASDGNFYGTTTDGGETVYGTVFKMTPEGVFTTLHSFTGADGAYPLGALVEGTDGDLYGTTYQGGEHYGYGTIFKITPQGELTTLHSFDSIDGANPYAGLIQASNGNFYGTTSSGGLATCEFFCGTIFEVTPAGTLTTVGYAANPEAGLVQATDGSFYGTSKWGGANCTSGFGDGCGTVFRLTQGGRLGILYNFCSQLDCADGWWPVGGLVQATNGIFYGTTTIGGSQDQDGGTAFSLATGLEPFVITLPTSRAVGQRVAILGNNLTGATSVTFNGTPATFTVVSSTEISATVPAGAATGPVQVVTPTGTLTSNVNFQVLP